MTAPSFGLGPYLIFLGVLLALGFAGVVIVLFALFMRFAKQEKAKSRRRGFDVRVK